MKHIKLLMTILFSAFILNGCAVGMVASLVANRGNNTMSTYSITKMNQKILSELANTGYRVKIGTFKNSQEHNQSINCRLMTSVTPPKQETYRAYIQHAFEKEFKAAKLYDPHAKVTLYATINAINGSSMYGDAYWSFDIMLSSSNGKYYQVKSTYTYDSSITATYACEEMHKTFPIALQKLIYDVISNPNFKTLLAQQP